VFLTLTGHGFGEVAVGAAEPEGGSTSEQAPGVTGGPK
jgi:hypothetical protein